MELPTTVAVNCCVAEGPRLVPYNGDTDTVIEGAVAGKISIATNLPPARIYSFVGWVGVCAVPK